MARLGLETHLVDGDVYREPSRAFAKPGSSCRPSANCRPFDYPAGDRRAPRRCRPRRAPSAQPVSRPLVQRRLAPRPCRDARRDRTAARADRRPGAHRVGARRPFPDDPRPQGARGLRLPGAARRHRPVRPDAPPRDLALDRQLLPRRRRHLAHPGLPRRRRAAGEHEPGAFRLARPLGRRPRRHHPHARLGEQRQGDLRRLRRARSRSGQYRLQPVLRIRQLPRPPPVHRRGAGARLPVARRGPAAGAGSPPSFRPPVRPGTIAAGDHLKATLGAKIAAVEAVECPTLLYNGFGEHNIQGIGDKHVPLIHNVMNTDVVVGVSDRATDTLLTLFNTDEGRRYLVERRGVDPAMVAALDNFGISSICNILAAIKTRQIFRPRARRRRADRRHRRRGDVRQRSRARRSSAISAIASTRSAPARPGAARSPRPASTTCSSSATSTASGSSTSAISPGSSSRACRSPTSRRGRARPSGTGCSISRRPGTR